MSQVNACPQPDWQTLLQELSQDNSEIASICKRLANDTDSEYAADMTEISQIESDESHISSQLSKEVNSTSNPAQAKADLATLNKFLSEQKSNVAEIKKWHNVDPQQFAFYADYGIAISENMISPDISSLRNDD